MQEGEPRSKLRTGTEVHHESGPFLRTYVFSLDIDPPTHTWQSTLSIMKNKKTGKRFVMSYEKKQHKDERKEIEALLQEARKGISSPFRGPISFSVDFVMPYKKSERVGPVRRRELIPKDTRPDCSNMVKMIEDLMTKAGFWKDDSQNYSISVTKYWGHDTGIYITMSERR